MILFFIIKIEFFWFYFFSYFDKKKKILINKKLDFANLLMQNKAKNFLLAGFDFLDLDFLALNFLILNS